MYGQIIKYFLGFNLNKSSPGEFRGVLLFKLVNIKACIRITLSVNSV